MSAPGLVWSGFVLLIPVPPISAPSLIENPFSFIQHMCPPVSCFLELTQLRALKAEACGIFKHSTTGATALANLYDEFTYILDEDARVAQFLKQPHSLGEVHNDSDEDGRDESSFTCAEYCTFIIRRRKLSHLCPKEKHPKVELRVTAICLLSCIKASLKSWGYFHRLLICLCHQFKEQIDRYRQLATRITYGALSAFKSHMILIECKSINKTLADRAEDLAAVILQSIAAKNVEKDQRLCEELKGVEAQLIRKPQSSQDLVDSTDFLAKVKGSLLKELYEACASGMFWVRDPESIVSSNPSLKQSCFS